MSSLHHDDYDVIFTATVAKNAREEIRVTLSQRDGLVLFGARVWFRGNDGKPRASKNGFAVKVEKLPELSAAVAAALDCARAEGLLDDDSPL